LGPGLTPEGGRALPAGEPRGKGVDGRSPGPHSLNGPRHPGGASFYSHPNSKRTRTAGMLSRPPSFASTTSRSHADRRLRERGSPRPAFG
jgi:hypothetical protein